MSQHNLISIDLAENVFQICGVTDRQSVIFNRQLKRKDLVAFMIKQSPVEDAMEACYSSHYWGKQFESMGHQVKLIPAQHITPFSMITKVIITMPLRLVRRPAALTLSLFQSNSRTAERIQCY
jgi:transposase